jgi:hypothetical protein
LLHDDRRVAANLHDHDDDGLTHYYVYFLFETCRTTLDLLRETLSLDNVVSKDKTIQISESCAIDEAGQSTSYRIGYR